MIRGIERYDHRMIAYSLGNFAGYHNFGLGGALSLSAILQVRLRADGTFLGGRWVPLVLTGPGIPQPDPSAASAALVDRLSHEDFRGVFHIARDGTISGART